MNTANTPPTNQQVAPPNLANVFNAYIRAALTETNCHQIGIISTFNATKQTASIQIALQRNIPQPNPQQATDPSAAPFIYVAQPYPLLTDVPVAMWGGGGCSLTFPVSPGDECLVCFNDRCFDSWFANGTTATPPNVPRIHSLSDGIALVGIRSTPNFLPSISTTDTVLQNGKLGGVLSLGTKVSLANNATSLKSVLLAMNTQIIVGGGGDSSAIINSLLK